MALRPDTHKMKITTEHKLYLEFAIGSALRVLPIFEKKYEDKKEPRLALEAARNFLNNPTVNNLKLAKKAAADADAAAYAAYAAADADAAAYAAYAAAYAAYAAAYAAYAAAYADAAYAAAYAADAAADERKWQAGFLAHLNFKFSLSIKIRGVE